MTRPILAVASPKLLATWEPALRAQGFDVVRAAGRDDAQSELRRSNFSAVVVSGRLPWNGATRVARAVHADPGSAAVPVLAVGLPEITTAQRLRLRSGAPDATVPANARPEALAAAVAAAIERGPVPLPELNPEQQRAMRMSRIATWLMLFGVVFSMQSRNPGSSAQAWWVILVPAGGLLADYATGRVDGRARLLSWQGWAAIVLGVGLAAGIVLYPGFFAWPTRR
jgi:DNA-binding NarL/FixJ family response regulator